MDEDSSRNRRICGWIGAVCLLLIIPIKLLRLTTSTGATPAVGIAPSILGPPGLLFLLRSSTGRISRLTLAQTTLLVGILAVGLEFMQLLPRPGILARVSYTFDPLDLGASLCSLVIAYGIIRLAFGGLCRRFKR
jgi:hypothetical protein